MSRARLAVIALAIVASSCSPEGQALLDAWNAAAQDLTTDDQPVAVRAAGQVVEAKKSEGDAANEIDQALNPERSDAERLRHAEEAVNLRPGDPKYRVYVALLQKFNGDSEAATTELRHALALIRGSHDNEEAASRAFYEYVMEVTSDLLNSETHPSRSQSLASFFCYMWNRYSVDRFGQPNARPEWEAFHGPPPGMCRSLETQAETGVHEDAILPGD